MKNDLLNITVAHTLFGIMSKLINIFGVIFFYKIFDNSISKTLLVFCLIHGLYAILILLIGSFIGRIGLRISSIIGLTLFFFTFIILNIFDRYGDFIFLLLYIIIFVLAKSFYHLPVSLYKIKSIHEKNTGSKVGLFAVLWNIVGIVVPVLGGILSSFLGSLGLIILALVSVIPSAYFFYRLPNTKFQNTLKLNKIFKDKTFKNILEISIYSGIGHPLVYVWPVWLYLSLNSNFNNLGIFTSGLMIIALLIIKLFGKYLDQHNKKRALHTVGLIQGIEFLAKFLSISPLLLVIADLFGKVSIGLFGVAKDSYLFTTIDHHHQDILMDERAILSEFEINTSVSIAFGILSFLYLSIPMNFGFLIYGLAYILLFLFSEIFSKRKIYAPIIKTPNS